MTSTSQSTLPPYTIYSFTPSEDSPKRTDLEPVLKEKLNYFIAQITALEEQYSTVIHQDYADKLVSLAFQKLDKTLKSVEAQLKFLLEMLIATIEVEVENCRKKFEEVSKLYEDLREAKDISFVCTIEALDTIIKGVFDELGNISQKAFIEKKNQKVFNKDDHSLEKVIIAGGKLETIATYFPSVVLLSKHHLFAEGKYSPVWTKLKGVLEVKEIASKDLVKKGLTKLYNLLGAINAVSYDNQKAQETGKWKNWSGMRSFKNTIYYINNKDKAKVKAELKYSENTMETAFTTWLMADAVWAKRMRRALFPSMKVEKKLYIPRLFPRITREGVLKEYEDGTLEKIRENTFVAPDLVKDKKEVLKNLYIKDKQKIRIRLISTKAFDKPETKKSNSSKYKEEENLKGIVIHIHGGGFVAGSSSTYRKTLMNCAKALNLPVFSIDYRLAPEDPYPAAQDDIWQAYNWIINYCESILDIPASRIVLFGDSAGGNLVMGLTMRTIKEGVKVPDGCWMTYPSLSLYPKYFWPSYLRALDDMILPYSMLTLIIQAYVPSDMRADIDPFLSPIVASDEILKRLPPIRITTGTDDPLHDDVWLMISKLLDLGKDVKGIVYENLPHGYMGMVKLPNHNKIVQDTFNGIRDLFVLADKKNNEEQLSPGQ